ncbi:hypothetical protein BV20DRAFT_619776 [Pilatotrama ljubarskyi]|nr:hypothetical protein BV20DRAFT_619776 [Pilatotrama ljubarskyi]
MTGVYCTSQQLMTVDAHRRADTERDLLLRLQTIDEMVRLNEEAERRLHRLSERRRIPPVPDMRFEYSYVRSVAPYVHLEVAPPAEPSVIASEKGKEKAVEGADAGEVSVPARSSSRAVEVARVEWGRIFWITTRDQVISPLVQGALWGVASHFLRPLGALLGAHIRAWWSRGETRGKDAPDIEGNGVQWLRNWMASILSASVPSTSNSLHEATVLFFASMMLAKQCPTPV